MGLGQVLGVSEEGQQEAKRLQPHKTSHNTLTNDYISPITWFSSCISLFDTLSSSLTANCGFVSHSLVAPGTRRILADQHKTPKTSVRMYANASIIPQYYSTVCITTTGSWVASGSRCYIAPRLPHCAALCRCVYACRVCSTGALQYTRSEPAQ